VAFKKKTSKKTTAKRKPKPVELSEEVTPEVMPEPPGLPKAAPKVPADGPRSDEATAFTECFKSSKLMDIASVYNMSVRKLSGHAFHTLPKSEKAIWYALHADLLG
jgi:hypothetical protein